MESVTDFNPHASAEDTLAGMIKAKQAQIAAQVREKHKAGEIIGAAQTAGASTPVKKDAELSDGEKQAVEQLRARDREVRTHERAHKIVGGPYASQPTYTYQVGPDGKQYAVGGEVLIDASPIPDNPEATITKMMIVKAAALAPAQPSSADRNVAKTADAQLAQAPADLNAMRSAELSGETVDTHV